MQTKKAPFILSKKTLVLDDTVSVHHYLRKKVYSDSGDRVGRIIDVILKDDTLAGFIIRGREKIYIDKDYCELDSEENILLKIDPITLHKRKIVFDASGKRLGRVVGIERTGVKNEFDSLLVKKHIFATPVHIPASEIETARRNIILNKEY
jgi:sporulation protein YlmC with PRC-barrel domain